MKSLRTLCASVVALTIVGAASLLADTITNVPVSFSSLKVLQEWGERNSWGGCQVDVLASGTNRIAILRRAFTSGVHSCEFSVYVEYNERWDEALRLGVYWNDQLELKQRDDVVTVSSLNAKKEVIRFSISSLCQQRPFVRGLIESAPRTPPTVEGDSKSQ